MEEKEKSDGLKEVTNEVARELIGWENNKLFLTLNHLTTRPGQIVTSYCKGETGKYLSPVVYFFAITGLNVTIYSVSGFLDLLITNPIASKLGIDTSSTSPELGNALRFLFGEIGQKTVLLPIALLLTWLFYRKYNRSFKENSWFALYIAGHATLLATPTILYWYITKDIGLIPAMRQTIELTYWIWASKQFYNLSISRAIFLRISMFISYSLFIGISVFLVARLILVLY